MIHHLRRILRFTLLTTILASCAGERPDQLGVSDGHLTQCPSSPNCVSSQAEDNAHHIAPLTYEGEPGPNFDRLKQILLHRKDTEIIEERTDYFLVEFHTILFVDDGEFLLTPQQQLIHVRSASRLGYSDLGKNRQRLEEIRRSFDKASRMSGE